MHRNKISNKFVTQFIYIIMILDSYIESRKYEVEEQHNR